MKRLKYFALLVVSTFVFMGVTNALETPKEVKWEVSDITAQAGDSLIANSGMSKIETTDDKTTITYSAGSFIVLGSTTGTAKNMSDFVINPETTTQNRPDGYAWIGFNIKATGDNGMFSVKAPGENALKPLQSGQEYTDYVGINKEKLEEAIKNGTPITYTYEFNLVTIPTTSHRYTVEIIINPEGIVLYDKETDINNPDSSKIIYNGPELKKQMEEENKSEPPIVVETQTNDTKEEIEVPNTLDNVNIYFGLGIVSLISLIVSTYLFKKVEQ